MSRIDPPLHAGPSLPGGDASAGPSTPRAAPSSTVATRAGAGALRRFIWRVAKVGLGVALGLASAGAAALAAFSALA